MLDVPHLEVHLDGREPFTVRIDQAAQVKWDLERAKRRWPAMDDAQALWSTYVSWAAATRGGQVEKDMPFDVYADQIVAVTLVTTETADPTQPDPAAD